MSTKKILVLEDDFLFAQAMQNDLNSIGYASVEIVTNSTDLIEALRLNDYDLVFLDILLGADMTGLDLALEIDLQSKVPFIVLSNQSEPSYIQASNKAGASAFLLKGASTDQLSVTMQATFLKAKNEYVFLDSPQTRFRKKDILCVASYGHSKMISFIGKRDSIIVSNISFTALMEKINYEPVKQVHIAYYVNLSFIDDYTKARLFLPKAVRKIGEQEMLESIPIGRVYKERVIDYLKTRN